MFEFPENITIFCLTIPHSVPELICKLKGYVLSVMVLLVQFSLQLLVDPLVFLGGGHEGEEVRGGEGAKKGKMPGVKGPEERSEHIIFVTLIKSIIRI